MRRRPSLPGFRGVLSVLPRGPVRPGGVAFTGSPPATWPCMSVTTRPGSGRRPRARLESRPGLAPGGLRFMNQVHGSDVARSSPPGPHGAGAAGPTADAMVSAGGPPWPCMVADCVPVVLVGAAGSGAAAAVAHAGRPGVAAGVVPAPWNAWGRPAPTASRPGSARRSAAAATRSPQRCARRGRAPRAAACLHHVLRDPRRWTCRAGSRPAATASASTVEASGGCTPRTTPALLVPPRPPHRPLRRPGLDGRHGRPPRPVDPEGPPDRADPRASRARGRPRGRAARSHAACAAAGREPPAGRPPR